MGRKEIHARRTRLDQTFVRMPSSSADPEFQSDFARYLVVLVSGFLENSIEAILLEFAEKKSSPEVAAHVARQLGFWTNPNCEKIILSLFGAFNSDWRDKLQNYIIDEKNDSINSLVALRHKVAHGDYVGTTLSQVKQYYKTIIDVVEFMNELVNP